MLISKSIIPSYVFSIGSILRSVASVPGSPGTSSMANSSNRETTPAAIGVATDVPVMRRRAAELSATSSRIHAASTFLPRMLKLLPSSAKGLEAHGFPSALAAWTVMTPDRDAGYATTRRVPLLDAAAGTSLPDRSVSSSAVFIVSLKRGKPNERDRTSTSQLPSTSLGPSAWRMACEVSVPGFYTSWVSE